MPRLSSFVAGLLVGAAFMFLSLKYHVVHAHDGLHLVPKLSSDFALPYVDIREFTLSDWNNHRELAAALVRADKGDLLNDAAAGSFRQVLDQALNSLRTEPSPPEVRLPGLDY